MTDIKNSADEVKAALTNFEKTKRFIAVGGYVNSFLSFFFFSDLDILLEAIKKISKQITALQ